MSGLGIVAGNAATRRAIISTRRTIANGCSDNNANGLLQGNEKTMAQIRAMPGVWNIDIRMAVNGSVHYLRRNVPIQFWVKMDKLVQDFQDCFPEKLVWFTQH